MRRHLNPVILLGFTPPSLYMTTQWKPSVTVASVVERDGLFLLVEEETTDGIKLNQPAGHLDPSETPAQGAVREALEESAWEVLPLGLLGIYLNRYTSTRTGEDVTYLRFAFAAEALKHRPELALDEGILRVHWLSYADIKASMPQHRSPLVLRCVEDHMAWKNGQRAITPLEHVYTDPTVLQGAFPNSNASHD